MNIFDNFKFLANENQPIRGRMMHGMMKAFRTSKNNAQQPSSPAHPNAAASSSAQVIDHTLS